MPHKVVIGGHLRAAEGLRFIAPAARALKYNAVQIMLGGERDYNPYDLSEKVSTEYRTLTYGIETYVHLPYVINPCEEQPRRRNFYRTTFRRFTKAAMQIGAKAVVLHPGFKKDLTRQDAYRNLLKFTEDSFEEDFRIDLLYETDSGSKNGSAVGTADFIYDALRDLENPRVGMCIDTTHLYARGIDLWEREVREAFLEKYHGDIRLIHLNNPDQNVALGSFLDRHNSPFESRMELDHPPLIREMVKLGPCILERRSLGVQEQDVSYIRKVLELDT